MKITSSSVLSLSGALLARIFTTFKYVLEQKRGGKGGSYHVPYPQNDGARPDMAAQAAARRVPPVPRRNHPRYGVNLETSS